jgi:hypothetical protein
MICSQFLSACGSMGSLSPSPFLAQDPRRLSSSPLKSLQLSEDAASSFRPVPLPLLAPRPPSSQSSLGRYFPPHVEQMFSPSDPTRASIPITLASPSLQNSVKNFRILTPMPERAASSYSYASLVHFVVIWLR